MTRGPFVVEFGSGLLFRGPRSNRGGSLGEAMRFQQAKHATAYIDAHAPWAWFNGACVMPIDSANTAIANWRHRTRPRHKPQRQTFWTTLLLDSEGRDGWVLCADPACTVGRPHAHRGAPRAERRVIRMVQP